MSARRTGWRSGRAARLGPVVLLVGAGAASGSCGQLLMDPGAGDRLPTGITTITATLMDPPAMRGSLAAPLPFSSDGAPFHVHLEVHNAANDLVSDFNGFVTVSVAPGVLTGVEGATAYGRSVQLQNGAADVTVRVARSYGETRISAEDDGYTPATPDVQAPACADGMDNDGDGRADFPADYGCAAPNDQSEQGGSYAVGSTDPVFFAEPTLYQVQGGAAMSPLVNARVDVGGGPLVVTRISTSGFWVTDLGDRSCGGNPCFNSIFAFNFSTPAGMRACDVLSELQGSVQEFVGTTQLSQPSWLIDPLGLYTDAPGAVCPIPPPVPITPDMLMSAQTAFEPYESSLVRAVGVTFSTNVGPALACNRDGSGCMFAPGRSNCDLNGSGTIDFTVMAEANCANGCQQTANCSEWINWSRFGQLAVDFPAGMQPMGVARLSFTPRDARPEFDPQRPQPDLMGPVTITGTLKQVGPNWIIEPRCGEDLHPGTTGAPATNASCVLPRTIEDS